MTFESPKVSEDVFDPGPIRYSEIESFRDPDLEHGLRHSGFDPDRTEYRLIEIPLASITDTRTMPWPHYKPGKTVEAIQAGVEMPPLVVMKTDRGWALLDGTIRTHAYLELRRETVRVYELLASARDEI